MLMGQKIIGEAEAIRKAEELRQYCKATGCMFCPFFRHSNDLYIIGNCAINARPRDYPEELKRKEEK